MRLQWSAVSGVAAVPFAVFALTASCAAAEQNPTPKPGAVTKPPAVLAKPAAAKPAAKPKKTLRTEGELGGMTSETTDQFNGRINLSRTAGKYKWWIRPGYYSTWTRTYSTAKGVTKVSETQVSTFTLDTQYRRDRKSGYEFISAGANVRRYETSLGKQGYYMVAAGFGRPLAPSLEAEMALAKITRYGSEADNRVTPLYTLRLKTGLTESLTLDGDTHMVQPFSEDTLVDSRVSLTCKLTQVLSMRFTYIANNMLGPIQTRNGWDKSFRISLVLSGS